MPSGKKDAAKRKSKTRGAQEEQVVDSSMVFNRPKGERPLVPKPDYLTPSIRRQQYESEEEFEERKRVERQKMRRAAMGMTPYHSASREVSKEPEVVDVSDDEGEPDLIATTIHIAEKEKKKVLFVDLEDDEDRAGENIEEVVAPLEQLAIREETETGAAVGETSEGPERGTSSIGEKAKKKKMTEAERLRADEGVQNVDVDKCAGKRSGRRGIRTKTSTQVAKETPKCSLPPTAKKAKTHNFHEESSDEESSEGSSNSEVEDNAKWRKIKRMKCLIAAQRLIENDCQEEAVRFENRSPGPYLDEMAEMRNASLDATRFDEEQRKTTKRTSRVEGEHQQETSGSIDDWIRSVCTPEEETLEEDPISMPVELEQREFFKYFFEKTDSVITAPYSEADRNMLKRDLIRFEVERMDAEKAGEFDGEDPEVTKHWHWYALKGGFMKDLQWIRRQHQREQTKALIRKNHRNVLKIIQADNHLGIEITRDFHAEIYYTIGNEEEEKEKERLTLEKPDKQNERSCMQNFIKITNGRGPEFYVGKSIIPLSDDWKEHIDRNGLNLIDNYLPIAPNQMEALVRSWIREKYLGDDVTVTEVLGTAQMYIDSKILFNILDKVVKKALGETKSHAQKKLEEYSSNKKQGNRV